MAVPDFQSWFLPLLRRLGDGADHAMSELYEQLADDKGLSTEDRAELVPGRAFIPTARPQDGPATRRRRFTSRSWIRSRPSCPRAPRPVFRTPAAVRHCRV